MKRPAMLLVRVKVVESVSPTLLHPAVAVESVGELAGAGQLYQSKCSPSDGIAGKAVTVGIVVVRT